MKRYMGDMFSRVSARTSLNPSTIYIQKHPLRDIYSRHISLGKRYGKRHFSIKSCRLSYAADFDIKLDFLSRYKNSFFPGRFSDSFDLRVPDNNAEYVGKRITVHGFLGKRKDLSEKLSFVPLALAQEHGSSIQVVSRLAETPALGSSATSGEVHKNLRSTRSHSAVSISGILERKRLPSRKNVKADNTKIYSLENLELVLQDITCLAEFPEDIVISDDVQFGPEDRHLQLRFDPSLRYRLKFRNWVLRQCRIALDDFEEIETPILFKSTPEGAREFLVPTRRPGYAYALPQSPQQYKQILMASGIYKYFQIAKCFRDEDLRADRQPEFTQVDLEMAFSDGEEVMKRTECFVRNLFDGLVTRNSHQALAICLPKSPFPRITYHEAMHMYGSDKPDLRIKDKIHQIDDFIPKDLIRMVSSLKDPVVECWRLRFDLEPAASRSFMQQFMDSPEGLPFQRNLDGAPGVFIYDPRQPLEGLQAFGHEGSEKLKALYLRSDTRSQATIDFAGLDSKTPETEPFWEGDLIVIQARPRTRLSGGSTTLGRLRTAIHKAAVSEGLISQDENDHVLWITDFPLFTPDNDTDPGQGGSAGFSATHHPFTAPKSTEDVELLLTNPAEAIADHYDLVINGVEIGGGSRRIHNSDMQQFVMRDILKMSEERLKDFSHLFKVLRAGCPPHAGIALGLDRLIALMLGVDSVRDVIAFPKSGKGEDLLTKSPSLMTREQQEMYHFAVDK